jgi:(R,R)-butanediol dehydrogenase/meso-butanediol dehydrogenase/diacetyl reductase
VSALPIRGCGECPACKAGEPSWCVKGLDFLAGGYAQYARAGARECLKLPAGINVSDGALVEPLAVALHGVRMAPSLKGATVTILGAGPIGMGAVFWAKHFGAKLIQVVEGNVFRAQMALAMGADKIFSPPSPDKAPDPATAPVDADLVFECVGKPGLLLASLQNVRPRGTLVSLGFCMAQETFFAAAAAQREVTIKFPILYTISDFQTTLDAFEKGAVEPRQMITETIGFDQLPETFESLRKPGSQCKVMIDPWA